MVGKVARHKDGFSLPDDAWRLEGYSQDRIEPLSHRPAGVLAGLDVIRGCKGKQEMGSATSAMGRAPFFFFLWLSLPHGVLRWGQKTDDDGRKHSRLALPEPMIQRRLWPISLAINEWQHDGLQPIVIVVVRGASFQMHRRPSRISPCSISHTNLMQGLLSSIKLAGACHNMNRNKVMPLSTIDLGLPPVETLAPVFVSIMGACSCIVDSRRLSSGLRELCGEKPSVLSVFSFLRLAIS